MILTPLCGQQTRDTIYMTYQDPHHPIFVAEATAMRCVSALKSLKALTLADHWRRPPFSRKLVVGKYLLKPTSWDVCPWTEIHAVYLYRGSPKWHCHHLGFVLFVSIYRAFLSPLISIEKTALSCWTSWFQSSTSSCTHLAWSRCHHLRRRVMGHRIRWWIHWVRRSAENYFGRILF